MQTCHDLLQRRSLKEMNDKTASPTATKTSVRQKSAMLCRKLRWKIIINVHYEHFRFEIIF